jgi:hypothetical protein
MRVAAPRGKRPTITRMTAVAAGLMVAASARSSESDTSGLATVATVAPTTVSIEDRASATAAVLRNWIPLTVRHSATLDRRAGG